MLQVRDRDIRDLALASLSVNLESHEKQQCLRELQSVSQSEWYRCEFRNCDLLLIYGGDEVLEKNKISWTAVAQKCPTLQSIVKKVASPYFHTLPRIIILKTQQKEQLHWHVDCNQEELDSFQPKLRCLISGQREDLFYLSNNGKDKIYAPVRSDVYYMSGAYVHSLKNESSHERYVLCFGSPWGEKDVKDQFLEALGQLPSSHLLWNDELILKNRHVYVRDPAKHGLNQYARS